MYKNSWFQILLSDNLHFDFTLYNVFLYDNVGFT